MIKINLLPYLEKKKKENVSRQLTIIVGLFAIFILALIWGYLHFSSQVASLESKVADSRQTLRALDEKIGDLEKFKKQKALLELKLDVISNLEETKARGGQVVIVATTGDKTVEKYSKNIIKIPDCQEVVQPILVTVALQLFAYYVAVARGTDVDQPRNLAKSVTVE